MSVQMCEGVWRNRTGQRVVITQCEPVGGQQWTDGLEFYSDDGRYYQSQREDSQDLVSFVGLLPVNRPAETESTTAVAGGVSEDPGRIIYELEERLAAETKRTEQAQRYISTNEALDEKTAEIDRLRIELQETYAGWSGSNSALAEQTAEIDRLKAQWQSEFTAAQQLRSEVQQLERLLDDAREELQQLQADQAADEQHSEGERAAYLGMIKALWEMRS